MKKKVLSILLASVMAMAAITGCGAKAEAPAADAGSAPAQAEASAPADASAEGKVLNIYCWNEEFKSRVKDHYPGYEETSDPNVGKIGDVTVKWSITPSDDNAYQNNLDEKLLAQANASADDKIDLFLVEADYALKYVDTEYTLPVEQVGVTADLVADQYQYTKDIVTDSQGQLKGVSWQCCPGAYFYNRELAKEVFGTDEPAEIQKLVADWDKFNEAAAVLKDKGYCMTSSVNDTYRTYSNNVSAPWVKDGKVTFDANIIKWVEDSKKLYDAKMINGAHKIWSDDWKKGFYPEGKVFSYFGPAWLINFCMAADEPGSVANAGGWAATEGPQGFYWGGTWICAATGTDNASLVGDIMKQLTTNKDIMLDIVKMDDDFVNNKPAMEEMAKDTSYKSSVLGGQNPLGMYCNGAANISLKNMTGYDQSCNEQFQECIRNYFEGTASYDEAIELFKKTITEMHPELSF